MTEVKVWVDGIQRVVCGATYDTTCQDVVVALAYAMGRTGRFTLIEKWRDSSRPLTPADCPLQVLHKWGEYAAEVRFILCQANAEDGKQSNQDKLLRKKGEQSVFSHSFTPPHLHGGDVSVKRSLTFSGVHNHLPDTSVTSSSAPNTKLRKTQKGPVPNGDVQHQVSGPAHHPSHPSLQPVPRQQRGVVGGQQAKVPLTDQHSAHPVPPPRRRSSPAPSQPAKDSASTTSVPSSSTSSDLHRPPNSHTDRVSPFYPPHSSAQSHGTNALSSSPSQPPSRTVPPPTQVQSAPSISPRPQPQSRSQLVGPRQGQQSTNHPIPPHNTPSPHPPPLPKSPPPSQPAPVSESSSMPSPEKALGIAETSSVNLDLSQQDSLISSDHSRQASLEIEEYDLEHNFPDTHREYSRTERPSVSLEYRLEDGMGSGSGSGSGSQLEGEHAKLIRLVNMQQERLKTQESQIGLINTEITALEEKEKEYEEKLQVIMEELLLHENRQRDLEPQLNELEKVEWDNVLDGEKKCEADVMQKIASLKASIHDQEQKLEDVKNKESKLLSELNEEEEKRERERKRLQAEEATAREEESKMKEEISKLQAELSEEQKKGAEYDTSLSSIDSELKSVEKELGEKETELTDAEARLKDENLKDFVTHPVLKEDPKSVNSGETILKILEGRLSPRPPTNTPSKTADSAAAPPFLAALTANNQSGVWV